MNTHISTHVCAYTCARRYTRVYHSVNGPLNIAPLQVSFSQLAASHYCYHLNFDDYFELSKHLPGLAAESFRFLISFCIIVCVLSCILLFMLHSCILN